MSKMPDAFVAHEAIARNVVQINTWGHLFPTKEEYRGELVVASTCYDGVVIVEERIDIQNSPWWYSAVHDFIFSLEGLEPGDIETLPIIVRVAEVEDEKFDPDDPDEVADTHQEIHISIDEEARS